MGIFYDFLKPTPTSSNDSISRGDASFDKLPDNDGSYIIPWGSDLEFQNLLNQAGETWGVSGDAWKLLNEAEYTKGWKDFFEKSNAGAAVDPTYPRMRLPFGDYNQISIDHELPHLSSKYFRFLNADGSVRPEWQSIKSKGLTGYNFNNPDGKYLEDYLKYVGLENDGTQTNPTGTWARANIDQRAYNFTQDWLNQTDDSGQLVNRQRPELRNAIGKAMGYILADERLYEDSNFFHTHSMGQQYATDPEEVYARAMQSYAALSRMSEEERAYALTRQESPYDTKLPKGMKKWLLPDGNLSSEYKKNSRYNPEFVNYLSEKYGMSDSELLDASKKAREWNKSHFNQKENTIYYHRIRPETYNAIDAWMKENKLNKTGDGFAQIEIDNMLDSNMYA